jgi:hypothetical protein
MLRSGRKGRVAEHELVVHFNRLMLRSGRKVASRSMASFETAALRAASSG